MFKIFGTYICWINISNATLEVSDAVRPLYGSLRVKGLTFWRQNYFFLILAHPVYKMWITQEPNTLELWNKLHFEDKKKKESIYHV